MKEKGGNIIVMLWPRFRACWQFEIKDYIDSMHGKTGPKLDDCFSSHYQYEELLTAITCLVKVPTLSISRTFEKITKYAQHKVLGHIFGPKSKKCYLW